MKYRIKPFGALCELEVFVINDKQAEYKDFGDKYDLDRENAEDYGCGNMTFTPKPATSTTLNKYQIDIGEYNIITKELADKLSFGCCGWCV